MINLVAEQQFFFVGFLFDRVLPVQAALVRQLDDARILELARTLFAQSRLPFRNDVAQFGQWIEIVFQILFNGIVTE